MSKESLQEHVKSVTASWGFKRGTPEFERVWKQLFADMVTKGKTKVLNLDTGERRLVKREHTIAGIDVEIK